MPGREPELDHLTSYGLSVHKQFPKFANVHSDKYNHQLLYEKVILKPNILATPQFHYR